MRAVQTAILAGVLVTGFGVCDALAQAGATAQMSGAVTDESGLALPGVDVTATQTDTGFKRSVVSDGAGRYTLPSLPTGPYRLEATLSGFKTFAQTGITLQVNANVVIPVVLSIGQLSETVSVKAEPPLVETRNLGVGQVMDNRRIMDLPLNGRNTADLLQFTPAAVPQPNLNANNRSFGGTQGGLAYSVAGGLPNGVAYILDGATHNNPYDNLNLPLPFPDALQEFRIETSALTAQNGMHAGAAVSAVTKSGTNKFHGDLFEFLRHHSLNATNPFNALNADGTRKDDGLKRNQYGGTLGGPILADRLFYFVAYQGTNTRQTPSNNIAFVPTAAMLAGDFTAFASAACNGGRALTLKAPFAGNQIDPSKFSPAALAISAKLPATTDPCGRVQYDVPTATDESQVVIKIDHQRSQNQAIFGRYMATSLTQPSPFTGGGDNILTTATGGFDNLAQSFTVGHNWVLSSKSVNSLRVAFNRTAVQRTSSEFFGPQDVGINIFSYLPKYTLMSVTNGFNTGAGTQTPATFDTNTFSLSDDVTVVRGAHQFMVGGSWAHWVSDSIANVRSPGQLTIDGSATGAGLADFLTGRLTELRQSAPNTLHMKQSYIGLYAQDTWRVSSRVTVNYGVRWEPFFPAEITNGAIYNFDLTRFQQGAKSTVYANAPAGLYFPGDPGFPTQAGMNKIWGDIGPRVGIAWDPTGSGQTSVRGSYGRSFDFISAGFHINTANAPPWGDEIRIPSPPGGLDNPFVGSGVTNIFPTETASPTVPFSQFGSYLTLNYDMKTPVVDLWNVTVERQLFNRWLVSVGYVGNLVRNMWETTPLNNGLATVTSATVNGATTTCNASASNFQTCMNGILNQRRPLAQANPSVGQFYGAVDGYVTDGRQHYNGLLLTMSRRAAQGVSISANYTLSKCFGSPPGQGGTAAPNTGQGYNDPNNHAYDDGNCNTDRRHVFTMTAGAETPQFRNRTLAAVASGWRLSGSFRALSGPFLTITTGTDRALNGQAGTQRANQILDDPYGDQSTNLQNGARVFLNPAAFAQPALGTLGTMQRNTIKGIGSKNLDLSLSRVLHLAGSQSLEVRAEAFNAFNWFQWQQPTNLNLNSSTFGQISSAGDPRIMQFAVKYAF